MDKLIKWLIKSNRWKHLAGGFCIGACADDWYTAIYAGTLTAGALEYKDKAHGGAWDWIDFALTVSGAVCGRMMFCWV
ncbi:MAG: putative periplasmic lipoprotein [Bacteriophage sp.]|nr:MAG: putative periplasmic lipoprotein [Bacteriophage sp.]